MSKWQTLFYAFPADLLEEGLSTADGQDIIGLSGDAGHVYATVYTPRSDDPGQDEENRCTPETRIYARGELVDLAVFEDTPVDLSEHHKGKKK